MVASVGWMSQEVQNVFVLIHTLVRDASKIQHVTQTLASTLGFVLPLIHRPSLTVFVRSAFQDQGEIFSLLLFDPFLDYLHFLK